MDNVIYKKAQEMLDNVSKYLDIADQHLKGVPKVDAIAQSFGVRQTYVPIAGLVLISVFMGYLEEFFSILIGTAYPAYASFKAIRTPRRGDDKQWLSYW